jgi:hypothetical protein
LHSDEEILAEKVFSTLEEEFSVSAIGDEKHILKSAVWRQVIHSFNELKEWIAEIRSVDIP